MKQIKYGSICSGIESASVAWEPLGFIPLWFSEIEAFPSAVLAARWPEVHNMGDMLALPEMVRRGMIEAPEVLVGGTPCQAFSVAGKREGMADPRGQLTIKYVELADAVDEKRGPGDECVVVWENVPGVLSDTDNAFGCFLGELAGDDQPLEPGPRPAPGKSNRVFRWSKASKQHVAKWALAGCIFGPKRAIAWRTLDAQYFGVAQRRRRVFVVASARKGFDPGKVLFESDGVRRDTPPSRETGEEITGPVTACAGTSRKHGFGWGQQEFESGFIQPVKTQKDSQFLVMAHGTQDPITSDKAFPLGTNGGRENVVCLAHGQGGAELTRGYTPSLTSNHEAPICFAQNSRESEVVCALSGGGGKPGLSVRRLTPTECERLQGFLDSHTKIIWRKKSLDDCPDGPRYKAIGNSKAVPVIKWLGRRLKHALLTV